MNDHPIGSILGGAAAAGLACWKFIIGFAHADTYAAIHWDEIANAMIMTIVCSFFGAAIGYITNHFMKKLFRKR